MKAKYILLAAAALAALSCNKFEKLSQNPYAMETTQGKAESFVQPMLYKTEYNLASVFRSTTAHLMQYAINTSSEVTSRIVANYNIPEGTSDDIWSGLYLQYGNACKMYETAVREESQSMQAVALVMKSLLITLITDTYGDVPFTDAGRIALEGAEPDKYTTRYDTQKDIYRSVIVMLEEANTLFADSEDVQFSAICDRTYGGDLDKWRRFGNALYAKVLNRIAMKVIEEDGGILVLNEEGDEIDVAQRLTDLYGCFVSGAGYYPTMRDRGDGALAYFDYDDEYAHTPFYSTTSGNWNAVAACDVLMRRMLDTEEKVDSDGITYYAYISPEKGGHPVDPRWDCYYRKAGAAPTQMLSEAQKRFFDSSEHKSSAGNSLIGRMTNGEQTSGISGKLFNVKNASHYAIMNYSELCFIFAEAGARGYIPEASSFGAIQDLFRAGVTESILEWREDLDNESPDVVDYVNHVCTAELFSGSKFSSVNAIEAILTEKWIAGYFVGIESWCDYRRTGYPLLKTNGPAAENKCILPTRLRYPADERYRNVVTYQEALDRWLGGTNNIQTDVWWASTAESQALRLQGRQ